MPVQPSGTPPPPSPHHLYRTLTPKNPDLCLYRAKALSQCGEYEEAATCVDAAIALLLAQSGAEGAAGRVGAEALADAYVLRGAAAFDLGDTRDALEHYAQALLVQPGPWSHHSLTVSALPRVTRALTTSAVSTGFE